MSIPPLPRPEGRVAPPDPGPMTLTEEGFSYWVLALVLTIPTVVFVAAFVWVLIA